MEGGAGLASEGGSDWKEGRGPVEPSLGSWQAMCGLCAVSGAGLCLDQEPTGERSKVPAVTSSAGFVSVCFGWLVVLPTKHKLDSAGGR